MLAQAAQPIVAPAGILVPLPTRDRILAAARALLRRGSYTAFTMDAVAHASGLSRRTIYNQFDDRDALYRASRSQLAESIECDLPRQLIRLADPALAVERFLGRALDVLARPDHVELSWSAEVDGESFPWVAGLYAARVEAPLVQAIASYVVPLEAWGFEPGRRAADLVAMMRAAVAGGGAAPLFSASELATIFLRRLQCVSPGPRLGQCG